MTIYQKAIVFDLETIRDDSMVDAMPDVKRDTRLKDPKKIAIDIAKKKAVQRSKMGLDPMFNMICCAGWCDENGPGFLKLEEKSADGEKDLLLKFWDILSNYDQFITFNGRQFDIRVMLIHGITHGIRPSVNINHGRYNKGNHVDLRPILAGDDKFAPGKLDFFCKKFLGTGKMEGIDGAMVQDYWDNGLEDMVIEYNQDEVQKMWDLFLMVRIAGLLE